MSAYILINAIVLGFLNILFLLLGSFFNVVVILCFWKSNNLNKNRCHFMILVLSCVDLAVVIVIHPLIISSTIAWYVENEALQDKLENLEYVTSTLYALTFYALLTMNIERYIAIRYPIYHMTKVTKTKLMLVFSALLLLALILKVLSATGIAPRQLSSSMTFLFLLIIMVPMNCKMYGIARQVVKRNKKRAEELKLQNKTEILQDSDKMQGDSGSLYDEESNKSHDESNDSHHESNNLRNESNNLRNESNNLRNESNNLCEESNNLCEESSKSHEQSNKSHEKSNKSHEKSNKSKESNNLDEESNNLQEESNRLQEENNKYKKIKNISPCILAVVCFMVCTLPGMIFNGIIFSQGKSTFDKDHYQVFLLWIRTIITMNSSFNTLVFFWKNLTLRKEGKQVLKKIGILKTSIFQRSNINNTDYN